VRITILASISGSSVHGTRSTPLKENGQVKVFATRAEADTEAAYLNRRMNGPHARARYLYTVIEESGQ
jgi:hypothetical protein